MIRSDVVRNIYELSNLLHYFTTMRILIGTIFLRIVSSSIYAQTFTLQVGTGAEIAGAVWGDFDNDGDLDILINTSQNNAAGRTRLLQSDGAVGI